MVGSHTRIHYRLFRASLLATVCFTSPLNAQEASETAEAAASDEIIVTARKREETSISVPVQISAISGAELEKRGIVSLDTLSQRIPQVIINEAAGGIQGGNVVIRGIATGDRNPFADQAVTFNVDGAQISRSSPRRMGQMDLAQVEVLKGPQALFFGKNSPGGVISIRTADPTSTFEAKASVGYETYAREWRGEGYTSGPISDTLGARFAFYGSTMRGWVENVADANNPPYTPPKHRWGLGTDEYAGRLTLKFEPSDNFEARLKVGYANVQNNGSIGIQERFFCPTGSAQTGDVDNCVVDHKTVRGDLGPAAAMVTDEQTFGALYKDGVPYEEQDQILSTLEMNFDASNEIRLTTLTSYYYNVFKNADNFTQSAIPERSLGSANYIQMKELGQELRIQSDFNGPLNFLLGGYFQDTKLRYAVRSVSPVVPANPSRRDDVIQEGRAYSAFAQMLWNIVPTLELSAGGRYSYEEKAFRGFRYLSAPTRVEEQMVVDPDGSWNDFSPEVMLTFRPTERLTVYGGYKHGFLSGGFNGGAGNFNNTRRFDQTTIKGFEAGVKARIGDVRANFGVYSYKLSGLQVSTRITDPSNPFTTIQVVSNAGSATLKGFEADARWTTPINGLSFSGAIAYNRARYQDFLTTCYSGQSKSEGCNLIPSPDGAIEAPSGTNGTLQQLGGAQIVRAPDWTATGGADYERELASHWILGLSVHGSYTGDMYVNPNGAPGSNRDNYWLLDASARIFSDGNGFEFAVIGTNLTDELYITGSTNVPFSGSGTGTNGPTVQADEFGIPSRGRQIMLRVSKKF